MPARVSRKLIKELRNAAIRPNWSPLTLYNLTRLPEFLGTRATTRGSLFQQKWRAKRDARRYHGEHLTLRQWQNLFKHNVGSYGVVPMDVKKMVRSSGAEYALGRGSGLGTTRTGEEISADPTKRAGLSSETPYAHMMWAPLERRLDMAVFRALFASSARQARQFVLHGKVKVNGRLCLHPNYMLNPGDMFSVDPEMVLVGTGQPKGLVEVSTGNEAELEKDEQEKVMEDLVDAVGEVKIEGKEGAEEGESAAAAEGEGKVGSESADKKATEAEPVEEAPQYAEKTKRNLANPYEGPDNLKDSKKPYATPWRPKDYMAPFAFIPRYLEVNHTICHAVYLRHPIASPGNSEIPSPFPSEVQKLAYVWYLKRG